MELFEINWDTVKCIYYKKIIMLFYYLWQNVFKIFSGISINIQTLYMAFHNMLVYIL